MYQQVFATIKGIDVSQLAKKQTVKITYGEDDKKISIKAEEHMRAKNYALELNNLLDDSESGISLKYEDGEYVLAIKCYVGDKRPWLVIYFREEGVTSRKLYSRYYDAEFSSDPKGDISLVILPEDYILIETGSFVYDYEQIQEVEPEFEQNDNVVPFIDAANAA